MFTGDIIAEDITDESTIEEFNKHKCILSLTYPAPSNHQQILTCDSHYAMYVTVL